MDTIKNEGREYFSATTFVKGLFSLEDQTRNYCRNAYENAGFIIPMEGYALYTEKLAGQHYCEHRDKYIESNGEQAKYYPRLLNYITKYGPVYVMMISMSLQKAKEEAPKYGIEVKDEITREENIQLVYDVARAITKKIRAEVMAGHEEGKSITKIQFEDPAEDKYTMNVAHCSDCFSAAKNESAIALKAMMNFNKAKEQNPNIIEDSRKELMPYEFGDEKNV